MLKILVISTWFVALLVNCIRFSWIIVGFFILTKLLAYTFFLENITPSLIFVIQNILISNNFYRENSSRLWEICVLSWRLSRDTMRDLFFYYYYYYYYYYYHYLLLRFLHFFLFLFPNQFFYLFFFCVFWRKKTSRHLVKGFFLCVLHGLVKICRKYVVLFGGNLL